MRRFFDTLTRVEEYTLTLTLVGLAVVAFVQVVCRYTLEISFTWFEEGGRYLGIFVTFLGAGLGAKRGVHFSMDLVTTAVGPRASRGLRLAVGLVSGVVLLVVAYYGFRLVGRNYTFGTTSPAMQLPMWLAYLPIPVFSAVAAVRFLLAGVRAAAGRPGEG